MKLLKMKFSQHALQWFDSKPYGYTVQLCSWPWSLRSRWQNFCLQKAYKFLKQRLQRFQVCYSPTCKENKMKRPIQDLGDYKAVEKKPITLEVCKCLWLKVRIYQEIDYYLFLVQQILLILRKRFLLKTLRKRCSPQDRLSLKFY